MRAQDQLESHYPTITYQIPSIGIVVVRWFHFFGWIEVEKVSRGDK